jgi:hypothetical protein
MIIAMAASSADDTRILPSPFSWQADRSSVRRSNYPNKITIPDSEKAGKTVGA